MKRTIKDRVGDFIKYFSPFEPNPIYLNQRFGIESISNLILGRVRHYFVTTSMIDFKARNKGNLLSGVTANSSPSSSSMKSSTKASKSSCM